MKSTLKLLILAIFFITGLTSAHAFSYRNMNSAYIRGAQAQARYCPRSMYNTRYQQPNRYIYTPQQARYNGYRTGINGVGYNNSYYYNRYRR